jgi:hypothetical protein
MSKVSGPATTQYTGPTGVVTGGTAPANADAAANAKGKPGDQLVQSNNQPQQQAQAERGTIPEPPFDLSSGSVGYGQGTLDRAFDALGSLEKELEGIDPSSPEGSKKMTLINIKMQRVQQVIGLITEIRKNIHDLNMRIIGNMR